MTKSHVGMGFHVCPICGVEHDEVVLFQTRMGLPPKLDENNFMGYTLCPEHQAMTAEYVALIECSNQVSGSTIQFENADRTGAICFVRRTTMKEIFNVEIPDTQALCFVEQGVISRLQAMTETGE